MVARLKLKKRFACSRPNLAMGSCVCIQRGCTMTWQKAVEPKVESGPGPPYYRRRLVRRGARGSKNEIPHNTQHTPCLQCLAVQGQLLERRVHDGAPLAPPGLVLNDVRARIVAHPWEIHLRGVRPVLCRAPCCKPHISTSIAVRNNVAHSNNVQRRRTRICKR